MSRSNKSSNLHVRLPKKSEAWSESSMSSMGAAIFRHDENCTLVDDEVDLKQMDLVEAI
jgi:hypothetical protein